MYKNCVLLWLYAVVKLAHKPSLFGAGRRMLNPGHIKGARFFGRAISEISGR